MEKLGFEERREVERLAFKERREVKAFGERWEVEKLGF